MRYGCRQNLAKQRFRYQGRFIKREELEKLDPSEIYDPNCRNLPKTKSIFKITKERRSDSMISSDEVELSKMDQQHSESKDLAINEQ